LAKKTILGTPDNEKGRDNNPIVNINNHELIFEDKEEDEDGIVNPSISAQSHSSSNRNIVATVHQSDPTRRTIQANTSMLRNAEESKYQDPEERGLLYMATHKTTKSNKQIDVNNAFSKAVERKSMVYVTWDNDIEQPTTQRYKKPQIRVNMASRKKVVFRDDGTIVSGPVVLPTDETHTRCNTNGYLRITHDCGRCNGIEMISRDSLNKSSLFRYFILYVV